MNEEIEEILRELQEACQKVAVLRDMYQIGKDYFAEDNSRKINEFNATFDARKEQLDAKARSFVKFIEKSFAPSNEDVARKKVVEKLREEYEGFDEWSNDVKETLIEKEQKSNTSISDKNEPHIKKRSRLDKSIVNPDINRPFPITKDFNYCKPCRVSLFDQTHAVSSWLNVLCVVANQLYSTDKNKLRNYISNNPDGYFTYSNDYRIPAEIVEGIYTERNICSVAMISRIKNMLDIYGIPYDELRVFLSMIASE